MGSLFSSNKSVKSDLESLGDSSNYVYPSSMTNQRITTAEFQSPRFNVNDPEMVEYLKEHGYVVTKEVLTTEQVDKSIELLWEFLKEKCQMESNDPSTWTDENFSKIGDVRTGILGFSGINQSDFLWYLRLIPNVKLVFQHIFGTDDLLTSFDGGNIFRPWNNSLLSEYHTKTCPGWYHVDQGRKLLGFHCIQGLVSLTDCNQNTGGFCVIPRSHLQHTDLMNTVAKNNQNFVMIPEDHPILSSQQILPVCSAGDMVLWDSRAVHCNTPALVNEIHSPVDNLLRIVGYICMTPTSFIEQKDYEERSQEEVLSNRMRLFERGIGTSHWPHLMTTSISKDTTLPKSRNLQEVNEEMRCLIVGNEWGKRLGGEEKEKMSS